jgi:hypothetical protein
MSLSRADRTLIALTLYASVLFGLFACGLHHGQMSGLSLSGLGGAVCALDADGLHTDPSGERIADFSSLYSCSLCSASALAVTLNSTAWMVGIPSDRIASRPHLLRDAQAPPRNLHLRHAINPRASPLNIQRS